MLRIIDKLVFPTMCFLIGLGSLFFKPGALGLFAGLLFFSLGMLHIASARFRLFVRTHGEDADPKDEFVVSRNEITSSLKTMISDSGAVDAGQFSNSSFQGTVEFDKCHDVPIALIPVRLNQPDHLSEASVHVGAGWGITYFCPADDKWKATPFFHVDKQSVIDAFGKSLSSILQLTLEKLS